MDTLFLIPLIAGFLLDSLLGDPLWLPHPVRWFGNAISFMEKRFNQGRSRRLKGMLVALFLIPATFFLLFFLFRIIERWPIAFCILTSVGVFYGLANRSLITEALKVIRALNRQGPAAGRRQLSFIVGRDTSRLDDQQIRTAVLETLAENLSDGVIAPLFFYALGGVPLMLSYKMVNTLDSMVGYKNERFRAFGWFAARMDDIANFIPARITALLMVIVSFSPRGFLYIFRYGRKHSSPNAGYPEAVLAGILNCRLGGPNVYHGILVEKPYIGKNVRPLSNRDVYKTAILNFCVCLSFILIICLFNINLL